MAVIEAPLPFRISVAMEWYTSPCTRDAKAVRHEVHGKAARDCRLEVEAITP
jgi:hypothetical protein